MLRNSNFFSKVLKINPGTVIHVGADKGQLRKYYKDLGCKIIIWCEADPENVCYLQHNFPDDKIIPGIAWDKNSDSIPFYIFKDSAQNSAIRPINTYRSEIPKYSETYSYKLDDKLDFKNLMGKTLLVIDVQGAEEFVLQGAKKLLTKVQFVIIEIALRSQGYDYMPQEKTLDLIMKKLGFRKSIYRLSHTYSYKDQMYLKCSKLKSIYIFSVDYAFDILMRLRHFILKHHWVEHHYLCQKCQS
jgi:FkbM family methyltransferase